MLRYTTCALLILVFLGTLVTADADDSALLREQLRSRGQIMAIQEIQAAILALIAKSNRNAIDPIRDTLARFKHGLLEKNQKAIATDRGFGDAFKAGLVEPFDNLDALLLLLKQERN